MDSLHEDYTEKQLELLKKYVSNTSGRVFVLYNLPEVVKGALFSKYSRSTKGLRPLLLKDFIENEELSLKSENNAKNAFEASVKKAQNFYDRVLDGYGDDSIGELGGAHLAIEGLSMLAAKVVEDSRIGGSPLEKSTRYICFDQKIRGEYFYCREPILMTSAYREDYLQTCDMLFDTYKELIPPLTESVQQKFPKEENVSKEVYRTSIRTKVLDCLRGLLPASTKTNVGIYGNGRFFQTLLHKMNAHNLTEMRDFGHEAFHELEKVVPSFVRRANVNHRHHQSYTNFMESMQEELKLVSEQYSNFTEKSQTSQPVRLIDYDEKALTKVAAALMFSYCDKTLASLEEHCDKLGGEDVARILESACNARENRRHKPPRGLERASYTFELKADFGVYRDLQRHRMLTQERQLLTCNYGYYIPEEILGTSMEEKYCLAMDMAQKTYNTIVSEFPEEAQYVVPMAYNMRWYFDLNLRSLEWLCELRSSAAGHPNYRKIAQEMAKQVIAVHPEFECFLKFVDYDGYDLGRLGQEQVSESKKDKPEVT